ncbi:MAG: metal-dependent hydrolase [Calditrichia bacterium]|nr:metal-dependent hydrolase [Calditrichia bacterium]
MVKVTFLSHSAFLIENEEYKIIIDPFLSDNPRATVAPESLSINYILLTHGHGDHIGDALKIAKANNATIIAPFELATYCQEQGAQVHPMHIGGGFNFPFGRIKLTIAHHGSMTPDGKYVGNPCGFLITTEGKTIYHAGDTGLFYDMKLIGEMNNIDLALLPIGDNFTMGIDDAVKAVELLQCQKTIPMHYNTFDVINADPQEFADKAKKTGTEVIILPIGKTFEFKL